MALALCLSLNLLLAACGQEAAPASPTPTANAAQETGKIDTILRDLLVRYQTGGLAAAREYARQTGLLDDQDRVRFGLMLSSAAAVPVVTGQINRMGGEVYTSADTRLGVAVDLNRLTTYFNSADSRNFFQELASFKEVTELKILLRPPLAGGPLQTVTNQGVELIGAGRWQRAGYTGSGIKVGIIDGGFANYRAFLGTALPPADRVEFKSFLLGAGEGTEPHGVAVAEVVHSLAPQAGLILAPIEDEIGFTRAVQYFIERKVQVLQISLGWGGIFPGDGTGRMNEKLDEARRAGILPVVSTGNYGQSHYLGTFNPNQGGFHRFGSDRLSLKMTADGNSAWVALRWEEPWNAPQTNLDLYVLDASLQPLVSSRNEQGPGRSPKPPTELAPFRSTPGQTYYIQVKLAAVPGQGLPVGLRMHLFAYNSRLEEATAESSVATPGDARGALSVGATSLIDDRIEAYSSRGPTGDGRLKPDLMAPSGIASQVFRGTFAGTSAAAPQVAGAAAVLWSAARDLTADQVALYLARNARDLGPPGRDAESGFGRVRLGPEELAAQGVFELMGAIPGGRPFRDDFQDKASGLPDNALGFYTGSPENAYTALSPAGQINWNVYLNQSFEEFRAEVTVQPGSSGDMFCGLIFWQQAATDYYVWLVSGNRYAVLRRNGPDWITILDWNQDAALTAAPDNRPRLSLDATAIYLRLRVGKSLLQTLPLEAGLRPARLGGKFGFVVGSFYSGPARSEARATFSNLLVTPLSTR